MSARFESLEAFLHWARERPSWELVEGEAAPPPPRGSWVEAARRRTTRTLNEALEAAGRPFMARIGGLVPVADLTVLAPDVAVVAAPEPEPTSLSAPRLVVEILSGWTLERDLTTAVTGWARLPTVAHALFVDPRRGRLLHAVRRGGRLVYAFHEHGPIELDALDVVVRAEDFFEPGEIAARAQGAAREPYSDAPLSGERPPTFGTVEDFMAWYEVVPGKQRFELVAGEVRLARPRPLAPAPADGFPRGYAARLGGMLLLALREALDQSEDGRRHDVLGSGLLVRIDARTALAPDVLVATRARRPEPDDVFVEPLLVAEILMPETAILDATAKLDAWLRRPEMRHVLLVDPEARTILRCDVGRGGVRTTLHREGDVPLGALGFTLRHAAIFDAR